MSKPSEQDIETSFITTLVRSDIKDAITALVEIGLDQFLTDGVWKDIPFLDIVFKSIKTTQNVRDWFFGKKVGAFLLALQKITPEQKAKFKERFDQDPKFARKTVEQIIIILDRLDELDKIPLMARVYEAYMDERINLSIYRRLTSAIERAFIDDLNSLLELENIYGRHPFFKQLLTSGLTEISDRSPVSNPQKERAKARLPLPPASINPLRDSRNEDYAYLRLEVSELGKKFIEIMNGKI